MKKKFVAPLLAVVAVLVISAAAGNLHRKNRPGAHNPSDQAVISAAGGNVRRNRTTGTRESLTQLLEGGANPDARDWQRESGLKPEQINLFRYPLLWWQHQRIDASGYDTALIVAARSGPVKSVEVLLAHGADVNATGMFDRTALHYAVLHGNLAKTRALVAAGADVNARSAVGEKPLPLAQKFRRREIVAFLQSMGAKN